MATVPTLEDMLQMPVHGVLTSDGNWKIIRAIDGGWNYEHPNFGYTHVPIPENTNLIGNPVSRALSTAKRKSVTPPISGGKE